jgi:hypothetical protein
MTLRGGAGQEQALPIKEYSFIGRYERKEGSFDPYKEPL